MLKKILLALIVVITAITNVAHAEDDMKTVASKAYVDTMIETKQLKIPAAGQPNVGAGETVMTYTANGNGEIGEGGLYSDTSSYDATTDGDKLITASALNATFTNLPTTPTTKLECANQADGCTLWTIVDQTAYGRGLPDGYTQLEYIGFTGTQYIDTGISDYKSTNVLKIKIRPSQVSNTMFVTYQNPNSGLNNMGLFVSSSFLNYQYGSLGRIRPLIAANTDYVIEAGNGFLVLNGNSYTGELNPEFTVGDRLLIGAVSADSRRFQGRIYYYRYEDENGNILFDGIPAKDSNDVIGLYDTVSGQFFTNQGTGNFVGPPAN